MEIFQPVDINLMGPADDISGIANVNRNIIFAALKMGLRIRWTKALEWWSHLRADLTKEKFDLLETARNMPLQPGNYVTILSFPPHYIHDFDRQAKINISYSLFETDRIPMAGSHAWPPILNRPEIMEVWVPANFQIASYKLGGVEPRKLKCVPMGVDTDDFTPHGKRMKFTEGNEFKLLTVMDVSYRKGPELLFRAYFEEFKDQEDTLLILKGYTGGADDRSKQTIRDLIGRIKKETNSKAKLLFLSGFLQESQLSDLHRSADVYVSASRGEGWALPCLQSMACGVPTIMPKHSSHLDYGTDQNCLWVEAPQTKITDLFFLTNDSKFINHEWWEPKIESLRQQMRYSYNNREALKKMGEQAYRDVQRFSWKNSVRRMMGQIGRYAGRQEVNG